MRILAEKLTYTLVVSSALMHVFCCGIPLVLALMNLTATFGIAGAGAFHPAWFEQFEVTILVVSGLLLVVTGVVQFISNRVNCRTDGACSHQPCDKKKRLSKRVLQFAVILYVTNLVLFFATHEHLFHAHAH